MGVDASVRGKTAEGRVGEIGRGGWAGKTGLEKKGGKNYWQIE